MQDFGSGSASESRKAKMIHKSRKNLEMSCFEVLDVLFRAEGFLCNLNVLYGGLGDGGSKLYCLIQKKFKFFSAVP
jgi:hypothetical protein